MTWRTFANALVVGFLVPASPEFGLAWTAGRKVAKLAVLLKPVCRLNVAFRSVDREAGN